MALPNEPGDGFGGNLSGNLKCSEVFLLIWDGEGSDIWDGIDRCLQQTCYDWTKSKYAPCQIMYYIPGIQHVYFGICERATGKVVQWADPWRHGVDYSEECYWDRLDWYPPPTQRPSIEEIVMLFGPMVDKNLCTDIPSGDDLADPNHCVGYVDDPNNLECSDGTDGSSGDGSDGSIMVP